jgi:hypothetical protein
MFVRVHSPLSIQPIRELGIGLPLLETRHHQLRRWQREQAGYFMVLGVTHLSEELGGTSIDQIACRTPSAA